MIFPLLLKQVSVAIATYKVVDKKQYEEEGWGLGESKCIIHGHRQACGQREEEVGAGGRRQIEGGGWDIIIVSTLKIKKKNSIKCAALQMIPFHSMGYIFPYSYL